MEPIADAGYVASSRLIASASYCDASTNLPSWARLRRRKERSKALCSHLSEAGDALATLLGTVPHQRLRKLLRGRPITVERLKHLKAAVGDNTYVRKARHSVGSHYNHADIKRIYEADLRDGRVDGSLIACDTGVLSRFTITDVLALRLLDDAAQATTHEVFAERSGGATQVAHDLVTAVDHLVAGLLKERVQATVETVEVPALLRAALDWAAGQTTKAADGRNPSTSGRG